MTTEETMVEYDPEFGADTLSKHDSTSPSWDLFERRWLALQSLADERRATGHPLYELEQALAHVSGQGEAL